MKNGRNESEREECPLFPTEEQITDSIHIDVTQIPDHVRDSLAAATLEMVKELMRDPIIRKKIKERTAERKARERQQV